VWMGGGGQREQDNNETEPNRLEPFMTCRSRSTTTTKVVSPIGATAGKVLACQYLQIMTRHVVVYV
jgi:hypothetical protein